MAVLAVSALALVAAACGDGEEETPPAETPALATPTVGAAPTEEAEPTPTIAAPPAEATPTVEAPAAEPTPTVEPPPEPTPTTEAPPEPTEPAGPATQTVDIAMIPSIQFDKSTITVQSGATVTVRSDNRDEGIPHSFSVYTDSSGSQPLAEASVGDVCMGPCDREITFDAPEPGEYFFRCDVHPTQMTGTFIVE